MLLLLAGKYNVEHQLCLSVDKWVAAVARLTRVWVTCGFALTLQRRLKDETRFKDVIANLVLSRCPLLINFNVGLRELDACKWRACIMLLTNRLANSVLPFPCHPLPFGVLRSGVRYIVQSANYLPEYIPSDRSQFVRDVVKAAGRYFPTLVEIKREERHHTRITPQDGSKRLEGKKMVMMWTVTPSKRSLLDDLTRIDSFWHDLLRERREGRASS